VRGRTEVENERGGEGREGGREGRKELDRNR